MYAREKSYDFWQQTSNVSEGRRSTARARFGPRLQGPGLLLGTSVRFEHVRNISELVTKILDSQIAEQ